MLRIERLTVRLPNGRSLLRDAGLHVEAGEAVVVAGPSGSGKSTLLRALFEPASLHEEGFEVELGSFHAASPPALVPQRGAAFDHLDVAGNVRLAMRYSVEGSSHHKEAVRGWLEAVDLDPAWAKARKPVSQLSGGEVQRLAVARALASGRRVLFFDEPSVGLDPSRVAGLAAQLRRLCSEQQAAVVVVTHDPDLVARLADRLLMLHDGTLKEVPLPARAGVDCRTGQARIQARGVAEDALSHEPALDLLDRGGEGRLPTGRRFSHWIVEHLVPFAVLVRAPLQGLWHLLRRPAEFVHVFAFAARQSVLRPFLFYAVVGYLLGFTVLYVLASFGGEFGPAEAIRIVRGLPLVALSPPLCAFLFVAASSNAVNAWLGSLRLSRQITAMEALGVSRIAYLWGPSWYALGFGFLIVTAGFAGAFLLGEVTLAELYGVEDAFAVLSADIVDPPPDRALYRTRALLLIAIYAVGCASDAIAQADGPKPSADRVTRAMTRSVVGCTLWVVTWELVSLLLLRYVRGEL